MKFRLITLLLLINVFSLNVLAQRTVVGNNSPEPSTNDTANTPYWIDMMGDPNANFYQTVRAFELYWEGREIEKGAGYKPFKRWEFGKRLVIDGEGNLPKPGSIEDKIDEYLIQNGIRPGVGGSSFPGMPDLGPPECLTNGQWVEIGPNSLSSNRTSQPNGLGRVNALAFHPTDSNIIFVGTPAGGLWSSVDGGKTWSSNTDTLPSLGVSSIAINPIHPDTIYIGTGDRDAGDSYGRGVLRSIDGGKTWQMANTGMGNVVVGRMEVDPRNPNVIIAATSSGIFRSTNHGGSWTKAITGNFKEVVIDSKNSNYIYAATYGGAKFYRSTDNGVNWTNITSGLPSGQRRMVVGVSAADSNLVYVLVTESRKYEGTYLSRDRGLTFKLMSSTPNIMDYSTNGSGSSGQAWYDLDIAIDPNDPAIVYVGGVNIFKSTDSGQTWKINAHWVGSGGAVAIHADQHVIEFDAYDRMFVGNDGGIYRAFNGGAKYTDLSKGLGIAQIYRLSQSATRSDMLINGFQDNGTGLLDRGSWHTVLGGDGMDCEIDPSNPTWAYSDLYYGDVRRYKDGYYNGRIAANGQNGITESGAWVTPFVLQEGTPSTMFIGYKNVWRSTNIQDANATNVTWTKISNNLAGANNRNISHLENSIVNPEILYMVRSDNKFFRTDDADAATPTWTDLTADLPATGRPRWVETDPKISDRVYIAYTNNKVYRSDDAGKNWTDISTGLPNIPILSLVIDSSSSKGGMYAGTYMGVFYTDTVLNKWVWFNTGAPVNSRVTDLDIFYSPEGRDKSHIVASTYGRGNWRSPLYDETQKAPIAEFNSSIESGCVSQTYDFEDVSLNNPTRWHWEFTPSSVEYLNGTDSCSQHPTVRFTAKGKYSVELWVENCNGKDSILKTELIEVFDDITAAKCAPTTRITNKNFGMGIFEVNLSDFQYQSGGTYEEGGYIDMGCKEVIELVSDTVYDFTVLTGKSYPEFLRLYIDFNNDGDFEDAQEMVWSGTKQKRTHLGQIEIPEFPVTTAILRARFMSDYDSIPNNACDTLRYGQTEDFGLRIKPRKPLPIFHLDRNQVCENETVILSDSSKGPIVSYLWVVENNTSKDTLAGKGPHSYVAKDSGYFKVTLILNEGAAFSEVDSALYAKPRPNLSLQITEGEDTACAGTDLVIGSLDSNDLTPSMRSWYKENALLTGEEESEIALYPAETAHTGSYFMVAEKDGCVDTSNVLDIVINGTPIVDYTVEEESQCEAYNSFDFANTTTEPNNTTVEYTWDFGDGTDSDVKNPQKSFIGTGQYDVTLMGSTAEGCADTLTRSIEILETPIAQIASLTPDQCLNNNEFFPMDSSEYSGSYTVSWDLGDGSTSTNKQFKHEYNSEGTYDITLAVAGDNGCNDTMVQQINVRPHPKASFSVNDNLQCQEDNLFDFQNTSTISSGSLSTFEWQTGDGYQDFNEDLMDYHFTPVGTFNVKLVVGSDYGCLDSTTRIVQLGATPIANFVLNEKENCFNENLITVDDKSEIEAGIITERTWMWGDGNMSTGTTQDQYKYTQAGDFKVQLVVQSDLGCADTSEESLTILPSPELDFEVDIVCEGGFSEFVNRSTVETGSITSYQWAFGDGNASADIDPMHRYSAPGTYDVQLIGASDMGCFDTLKKPSSVIVLEKPTAAFTFERINSWDSNTEVQFTDESRGTITDWEWDIESYGYEYVQNPRVWFNDTGKYGVQLIVTNQVGCTDTASENAFIYPETNVLVPNSFTPNGDDLNDEFGVSGSVYVREYVFEVYNRWGAVLFRSEDPNEKWDGKYQGDYVSPGMYMYYVNFVDLDGEIHKEDGVVNVIR